IPTLYTYVSELYPTRLRGSGFGWASAASRLATGIAPIVFGAFMWPVLGLTVTFILTGVLVVAAVVLLGFLARETPGEELSCGRPRTRPPELRSSAAIRRPTCENARRLSRVSAAV